jgi:hypothetical protein
VAHHGKGLGRDPESGGAGVECEYAHNDYFLAAALSGLGLWIIEAIMKRYEMRFYLRMRDIEVRQYGHASPSRTGRTPARMWVKTRYLCPGL